MFRMVCMPTLGADVPAVYVGDHGPKLKVLNTVRTSNDLAHMNRQSFDLHDYTTPHLHPWQAQESFGKCPKLTSILSGIGALSRSESRAHARDQRGDVQPS